MSGGANIDASRRDKVRRLAALRAEPGGAPSFAWPGGYPVGYLMDDGEYVCGACVNDPTNPVHADGEPDGWRFEGSQTLEGTADDYGGAVVCAHCGATLVPS